MSAPQQGALALAMALAYPLCSSAADADAPPNPDAATAAPTQRVEIVSPRQRLDAARNGLSPDTGSTAYRMDRQDLLALPMGENTPLNQVILQTPGVVQDSYGQLHVRGDHANVQYRINGVMVPEAISGFGQALETRFADHLNILTGALPAQYGLRNAAVVDIQSKGEQGDNGGAVGLSGGSNGHAEATAESGGTRGDFSWYLTASALRDSLGIENPTPARSAQHDQTRQGKTFGTLSYLLDPESRVSLLFGSTNNRFQIPDLPGQTPAYTLDGVPAADSSALDARQRERNRFVALSYQGSAGASVDYQVSLLNRLTDVHYQPDPAGDLQFNGIAADIVRRNEASGLQGDLSWRLNDTHTVRAGLFGQRERFVVDNSAAVFPADADGNQTSGVPITVADNTGIQGRLWSAYLQDEWQPVKTFTVNYGLRYDSVHTVVDESQWSPRLGLVWDASTGVRLHAGYARYFTPPPTEKIDTTSVQKFIGTTNALPSDANTAVRSERSDYYDAGAEFQLSPQLTLGIDGYFRDIRHLQDEGQFGNALIFSAFNYSQGRIDGLDLSLAWRDKVLSAYVNLGLSHAMGRGIETGQFNFDAAELDYIGSHWVHLDHEQRISGSAGLSYRLENGLMLGADALAGSGLRNGFANTEHLPGYATLNLAVSKTLDLGAGLGKLETRLALTNVFDRIYELRDGSGIGVGAPQYGARRSVLVGVNKPF